MQKYTRMMGFYDKIPFKDEQLKERIMIQISVLNTVVAIEMNKEMTEDHMQFIKLLASIGDWFPIRWYFAGSERYGYCLS